MTVNDQGAIHAYLTGFYFNARNEFPDNNTPYSDVMVADVNAGMFG